VEALSFPIEFDHTGLKKALEGAENSGTLKSRIRKYYHWCENDFIVSAQAILFGQLIWPPDNEVVQIESNVGLYRDKKGQKEDACNNPHRQVYTIAILGLLTRSSRRND